MAGAWMMPLDGALLKLENGFRLECVMERCPVMAATPIPLKAMTESPAAMTSGVRRRFFWSLIFGFLLFSVCPDSAISNRDLSPKTIKHLSCQETIKILKQSVGYRTRATGARGSSPRGDSGPLPRDNHPDSPW